MLLSSCPRCHDSIRIPDHAQKESVVRCPRCQEQFGMREIWSTLPPEAEIVSGPGALGHTVATGSGADYALADRADSDFQFKDSGRLQSDAPPMAKLDSSRTPRRPKKAEPNVAAEFAKIVVGGAAGLLIAVLAILWFGKQDVFKIVPKLPAQAYFLVPEDMRTAEMKTYAGGPSTEEPEVEAVVEEPALEEVPVETVRDEEDDTAQAEQRPSSSSLSSAFQDSLQRSGSQRGGDGTRETNPPPRQPNKKPKAEAAAEMPAVAEVPAKPVKPADEPLDEPEAPPADAEAAEKPVEEVVPKATEPAPIDAELMEKVSAASEELGPIGAEIPKEKPPADQPVTPVGDIDLSPAEDK